MFDAFTAFRLKKNSTSAAAGSSSSSSELLPCIHVVNINTADASAISFVVEVFQALVTRLI